MTLVRFADRVLAGFAWPVMYGICGGLVCHVAFGADLAPLVLMTWPLLWPLAIVSLISVHLLIRERRAKHLVSSSGGKVGCFGGRIPLFDLNFALTVSVALVTIGGTFAAVVLALVVRDLSLFQRDIAWTAFGFVTTVALTFPSLQVSSQEWAVRLVWASAVKSEDSSTPGHPVGGSPVSPSQEWSIRRTIETFWTILSEGCTSRHALASLVQVLENAPKVIVIGETESDDGFTCTATYCWKLRYPDPRHF